MIDKGNLPFSHPVEIFSKYMPPLYPWISYVLQIGMHAILPFADREMVAIATSVRGVSEAAICRFLCLCGNVAKVGDWEECPSSPYIALIGVHPLRETAASLYILTGDTLLQ